MTDRHVESARDDQALESDLHAVGTRGEAVDREATAADRKHVSNARALDDDARAIDLGEPNTADRSLETGGSSQPWPRPPFHWLELWIGEFCRRSLHLEGLQGSVGLKRTPQPNLTFLILAMPGGDSGLWRS